MPIIEMPDGARVQFPDDMPREQIKSLIAAKFPEVVNAPVPKTVPEQAEKWAPPGVLAPIQYQLGDDGKPVGARLAMPQVLTDAWNAIQAPGRAMKGEYDQVEVMPDGSVSQFDPRMVEDASSLAGLVAPVSVASRPAATAAKSIARVALPEIDDLYAVKDAAYGAVDKLGARYSSDAVDRLYGDMIRRASESNISPTRHPKAYSMLVDLQDRNQPMTLTQLDQLRQVIRRDLVGSDQAESHFGREFMTAIDDFIETAGPHEISGATADAANQAITVARKANTILRKSETLQDAMDNARLRAASTGSGGNIDNIMRQELRKIVSSPKKSQGFSKEEIAAMEAIITRGGPIDDALRVIGKLSPTGNGLMAALGLGATATNPLFAAAPAIGITSKAMSDRATQKAVQELTRDVRGASNPPIPRRPGPVLPKANSMLIEQQINPPPGIEYLPNGKMRLNT